MIRRGNGTTDPDDFKSDKGQAAAEKLNREVVQTENFWKTDTRLQPAFNDSIAKNTTILAAAERHLQEQGPKHLKKTKRFLNDHWLRVCFLFHLINQFNMFSVRRHEEDIGKNSETAKTR